jgi:hypothetical protein
MIDLSDFVPIPGHAPYLAHPDGRIAAPARVVVSTLASTGKTYTRSLAAKPMVPTPTRYGYLQVCLSLAHGAKGVSVHRLIALTFHGQPLPEQTHCAHVDGDKSNNQAANLKWCTPSENHRHKPAHFAGRQWGRMLFTPGDVRSIRKAHAQGVRQCDIVKRFGSKKSIISKLLRGVTYRDIKDE